jgi:hypothetical protein
MQAIFTAPVGHVVEAQWCLLEPLPTPLSELAKLVFSYHGHIAKLEDFSPFSSSVFYT